MCIILICSLDGEQGMTPPSASAPRACLSRDVSSVGATCVRLGFAVSRLAIVFCYVLILQVLNMHLKT